jgi:hypothetical protein
MYVLSGGRNDIPGITVLERKNGPPPPCGGAKYVPITVPSKSNGVFFAESDEDQLVRTVYK